MSVVVNAIMGIANAAMQEIQWGIENDFREKELKIQNKQLDIAKDQFNIDKKSQKLGAQQQIYGYEQQLIDLQGQRAQGKIDVRDANSQIGAFDRWLGNYQAQYDTEVAKKTALTEQFKASGQETFNNYMQNIGTRDSLAGATGRMLAGGSFSLGTKAADDQIVAFAGEDRQLNSVGGLYGTQLRAEEMEMAQIKFDLESQRIETEGNRGIQEETLGVLEDAEKRYGQSESNTKRIIGETQRFIDTQLG